MVEVAAAGDQAQLGPCRLVEDALDGRQGKGEALPAMGAKNTMRETAVEDL